VRHMSAACQPPAHGSPGASAHTAPAWQGTSQGRGRGCVVSAHKQWMEERNRHRAKSKS
jgi:hypothetical protein